MSTAASTRHKRLTALGIMLCLLAALFAIESKLAWYGPAGSPTAQVSASKLQAADAPRLVALALTSSLPIPHFPQTVAVIALALVLSVTPIARRCSETLPVRYLCWSFSPHLFFRPPPSL